MTPSHTPIRMTLSPDGWQEALANALIRLLNDKPQVLLCVMGKSGSGKSTVGKAIRKKGLPGIHARDVAVVDDNVLSVPVLGLFRRRVRHRSSTQDNLAAFAPYLKKKKVVVYANVRPEVRVARCDVVLRLHCPEPERRERLMKRNTDGAERFERTLDFSDEVAIAADYVFDLQLPHSTTIAAGAA